MLAKWTLPEGLLAALQAALDAVGACWQVRVQLCCDQSHPHAWAPPRSLAEAGAAVMLSPAPAAGGVWRSGRSVHVSPGLY